LHFELTEHLHAGPYKKIRRQHTTRKEKKIKRKEAKPKHDAKLNTRKLQRIYA